MSKFKNIIIPIILLVIAAIIFKIAPNYTPKDTYKKDEIRVIYDAEEITHDEKRLPNPAIIKDGKIMLSKDTIDVLFDKWIYYDEKYNTIITTTETGVAKLPIDNNSITINDAIVEIKTPATKIEDEIYIPIEELAEFYEMKIVYNEKVIITSKYADKVSIYLDGKLKVKLHQKALSGTVATAVQGEIVDIFGFKGEPTWVTVRTSKGDLGYAKMNSIKMAGPAGELFNLNAINVKIKKPKVNIIWESEIVDRSDEEKVECIDVIAPTWLHLIDEEGNVKSNIRENYIAWAHEKGYKIWAVFKNDNMKLSETSSVVTDMGKREKVINEVVALALEKNIDGINLDFEYMKKEDANEFSQFVRELSATCRRNNLAITVDVTVLDGSDVWSLCYDHYEIADAVDYMILMAYDQYSAGGGKAGSVASLAWVEENIQKLCEREKIEKEKIILGMPLYSRMWTISNGQTSSASIYMNSADKYKEKEGTKWLEEEGQYYYENETSNQKTMIWIENEESLRKKIELVNKYDLAGGAYWRWGYEKETIWNVIEETMNKI